MSDLPDSATDLIGEGSAHPSQLDKAKFDWLFNLNIDHNTAVYQPATPASVLSTIPSTPALPTEIVGSDHIVSPPRFSPDPEDELEEDQKTVSEQTQNTICESIQSTLKYLSYFFILFSLCSYLESSIEIQPVIIQN